MRVEVYGLYLWAQFWLFFFASSIFLSLYLFQFFLLSRYSSRLGWLLQNHAADVYFIHGRDLFVRKVTVVLRSDISSLVVGTCVCVCVGKSHQRSSFIRKNVRKSRGSLAGGCAHILYVVGALYLYGQISEARGR